MNRLIWPVLGLLGAIGAMPLAAQPPRVLQSPTGVSALVLIESWSTVRLEDKNGAGRVLPVPDGARLGALSELAGGWLAAGEATAGELLLLIDRGQGVETLGPPPGRFGFRRQPVPLVADGRWVGLAWLEGDGGENNSLMAAVRTETGWGTVTQPAPFAGQAQLGLAGTVLDDGSWLLVWAAVDGEDSEIHWSRLAGGEWSEAARLHDDNGVPDILPAVAAVSGGAVVAWSRLDGSEYRLRLARFRRAGGWDDLGYVVDRSSASPTVFPSSLGAGFVFPTGNPLAWSIIEVDDQGRVRKTAVLEGKWRRPQVIGTDATGTTLRMLPSTPTVEPAAEALERRVEWTERP